MIIKSNSIILATDLSPAFIPTSEFLTYKKGLYPLAIVNSLSFNVQNSRVQKKQLSSQSLSVNALQYSPTVDVSFNYTSSLAFENENFLGIYFRANEDYASSFLNSNAHSCNLYFIISDLYANDLIKHIETRGNLNGLTTICFGNCFLSSYSLSLQATDLPSVSANMQAANMEMKTISSNLISTPAINLAAGDQIGGAQLLIDNTLFIEHLQRLNTQTGNFPILPTRDSLYFQISNQNLQVPSVNISPSEDSAISSLELSFGIERENSYGFGSDFIYDSKIKYPILGSLSLSATSLNLHTGDGSLTGTMKSEQDYSLELMFSGANENSKFVKINNAKLASHSYQMDYAGMLSAQYDFNFECNEATGMAVKWGQDQRYVSGSLFSQENLELVSSDGSGLKFSPAGTYEVTVYTALDGPSYYIFDGERTHEYYYLKVNKTASLRYGFYFNDSNNGGTNPDAGLTAQIIIDAYPELTASQIATNLYNAALTAGFNVSILGTTVTFTASQIGNLLDAEGATTITNGSP